MADWKGLCQIRLLPTWSVAPICAQSFEWLPGLRALPDEPAEQWRQPTIHGRTHGKSRIKITVSLPTNDKLVYLFITFIEPINFQAARRVSDDAMAVRVTLTLRGG